ncbi:MAG: alanine--glyoxylate aminotransferase family protein [Spirochaetales bacterium]|nr:alanine--glyoxylate aminotransferase family protein [Spirochaetales bacterium]
MNKNLLDGVKETLLMGPGPSSVRESVYKAMGKPTIGHLDPYYYKIMNGIKEQLQTAFETKNQVTLSISGTGTAGMETCFANLIEKGDRVLVLINGYFGMRMKDMAQRMGAKVTGLEFEWGTPVDVGTVASELEKNDYKIVALVHGETSTGVRNPAQEIGKLAKKAGALYLVDAVTTFGGLRVPLDAWNIDAVYSGSQKCLSCPPGLSPVSFSKRAFKKATERKDKIPNWYLDIGLIANYWEDKKRAYHHTASSNLNYALYQALYDFIKEGPDKVFARHAEVHRYLVGKLEKLGLKMFVAEGSRLPMLNAVVCPEGVDEAAVRRKLLKDYHIEIGSGLGPLAGKIWRIGLMGHTARKKNVDTFIAALGELL